jgi:signal transduction histidine kinase
MRRDTAPLGVMAPIENERPVLVVLAGGAQGRRYLLDRKEEILIGRSPDADIVIDTADASRIHARIYLRLDGELVIEDRGSRNGTSVNNVPIRLHVLHPGDRIRLGNEAVFLFTRQSPVEDKFLEAQKMESVGRLAGGIAHDFNNLMAALLADVEYLKTLCDGREDAIDCLANMEKAASRAAELTNQLLSFAQQVPFDSQAIEMSELVKDIGELVRRTFDPNITTRTLVEPELRVLGDRAQLRQMLINLCLNAQDAMPEGGELEIQAELRQLTRVETDALPPLVPGPHVQLTVRDSGCGMDEDALSSAFEPFFTTKDVGEGTGLGLAAVYGIIKKHGGQVELESAPGSGTVATIWLSAYNPKKTHDHKAPTDGAAPAISGTVLIAVPSSKEREQLTAWVEGLGYRALVAQDGQEALRQFVEHRPTIRLVMLDSVLPKLSGKEVFHRLRRLDPDVRVVFLAGLELGSVDNLTCDGVEAVLRKPFNADLLRRVVERAARKD